MLNIAKSLKLPTIICKWNNKMEKYWIKKTVSVNIGNEEYIIALMDKIGFKEEERKTTGGYMGAERIQITFGGYNTDYHENDYVKVKSDTQGYFFFYSLRYSDGYFTNSEEIFKNIHDKAKRNDFEICSFGAVS